MHIHRLLALAFLVLGTAMAQADVRLLTTTLKNGLTVVLAPAVPSEHIAIHLSLDAGSRHDVSRGTAAVATRIVGSRLAAFKTDLNQERSVFAAEVAPEALRAVLGQLASALSEHTAPDDDFRRVRDQVLSSWHEAAVTPDGAAGELLLQLAYGASGHGHGPHAIATSVRREDVELFLKKNYVPASAVIALAGSFDPETVQGVIDATMPTWSGGGRRRRCDPHRVKLSAEKTRRISLASAKLEEIHIAYPTAVAPDEDWYALNILADIIGQGSQSRLQRALIGRGLAVDFAEGETESPCAASLLRMRARVAPDASVSAVMLVLDDELRKIARAGVSEEELATAHEQERHWLSAQLSTAAGVASAAARTALFYSDARRLNKETAGMAAVTSEDVRRVAQRYLRPHNRAVVIVKRRK